MFANAYKLASCFTEPVIVSTLFFDNSVDCSCGAFVVVNDKGWIITVAHLWNSYFAFQKHVEEIAGYNRQVQTIEQDQTLDGKQKRERISRLEPDPKWITKHSFWWGRDGVQLKDIKLFRDGDLLIGRLDPFDPESIPIYPVFKDPASNLNPGTSLCRLGYPFHTIEATFDEGTNTFKIAPAALPIPRFPIEGIYTRNAVLGKSKDGKHQIKLLETSSPGLRGQSGGPIFDVKGTVWAVQSRTSHLPLGFSPRIEKEGQEVKEHQFLNVGLGIHPELITAFLRDNGIKFDLSDY
jgi:hypothetical protein